MVKKILDDRKEKPQENQLKQPKKSKTKNKQTNKKP